MGGFVDAADFGFSPEASGMENADALQRAVDLGGTITVSQAGTYAISDTVYVGDNTSLLFGNDVFLKKVDEQGAFTHVLLNKGALSKTYNHNITVDGLHIVVNEMDVRNFKVYGLHGQLAFFYVKDLRITRFRCLDLGKAQYGVHVCTFEDIIIDDVIIKGKKDGVHLGRGKRFTIRNGVFDTYDDAVALNAHDYAVGNPELGWIENGVVEKCYDLYNEGVGFFCRILAGAWRDWESGMEVQQSDSVVSNGRIYRVQAEPDGTFYTSTTQPTHETGSAVLDGINWGVVQTDVTYTAGVRNVTFRDIFLEKPRIGFSIHFDVGRFSRSYYPGADIPAQEQLVFDNVRVLHDELKAWLTVGTPIDAVTVTNSSFKNNTLIFRGNDAMPDYFKTHVVMQSCVFRHDGAMDVVTNSVDGKEIVFKTASSIELSDNFSAQVVSGGGNIEVDSDLTGLQEGEA